MSFSLSKCIGKVCKSVSKSFRHVTRAVSSIARSGIHMVGSIFDGCGPRYNVSGCAIGNALCGHGGYCGGHGYGPFGPGHGFGPRHGFHGPLNPWHGFGPRPHVYW